MSDEPAAIADYFDEWADSVDPLWQGGLCSDNEALRERSENARTAARMLRQLDMLRTAIGDPDELRWHRWHCEETGQGDDLRELLVRIADAADVAVAEGAEHAETAQRQMKGDPTSKTSDEINAQRDAGWPDFHPEDYCHRCGRHDDDETRELIDTDGRGAAVVDIDALRARSTA